MSNQYLNSKGSIWRKWDLQVHTKDTAKNDQFNSPSFNEFCITLFRKVLEKEIATIGITDYFSIENYKRVKKFVAEIDNLKENDENVFSEQQTEAIKNIFILPNVELRMMPSTDSGRLVNIHCLFNPEFESSIENDFFGSIEYSAGSSQSFKMNRAGMISLGKSLDRNLNDEVAYKKGINTFVVSHGDLQKLYDGNKEFRDNVIIVVSNSNNDGASGLQKHYDLFENDAESQLDAVRKSIYSISQAIFSGNDEDKKYFIGQKGTDTKEKVIEKCGSLKPCIHGSDAHTEDKLFSPDNNRFCWIKADPTFEGLRQILWEPENRVAVQERSPSDSKSDRSIIATVSYAYSSKEEKIIVFNPDLNSIIGVRGSGKSTLLKNIAYKIDPAQYGEKDPKQPYNLENFKVKWADNQEDAGSDQSPKSIFYIPQGYLSALAYDDGEYVNERDQFLTELLKKNNRFSHAILSFESFASENKVRIEGLIQKLLSDDSGLKDSNKLIKKLGSKSEVDAEIVNKNKEITKYKGVAVSEQDIKSYTDARKTVANNSKRTELLSQDKNILNNLKESGANIIVSNQEFGLLSLERQELIKSEITKRGKENLINLIDGEINKIDQEVAELNKTILDGKGVIKKLEEQIKKSKALDDLTKEIEQSQKTLERIVELSEKIKTLQLGRDNAIKELIKAYTDYNIQQDAIYKTIEFDRDFSFLKIKIVPRYNLQKIKDFVERNINTRDSEYKLKQEDDIKTLFGEFPIEPSIETIEKVIIGLLDGRVKIKVEAGDLSTVVSQLLRNRYEIDYLNSVKTKVDETHFKDMTGGQKAIALLELIFRFDDENYPILIDQPEDDLDVGGVATDLVDFIKSEKRDRQIIIVSHNASLVVCSDTEEVITSTNAKVGDGRYDFFYKTGAIENSEIREDIIQILEGGREALKLRARKLNFKREI